MLKLHYVGNIIPISCHGTDNHCQNTSGPVSILEFCDHESDHNPLNTNMLSIAVNLPNDVFRSTTCTDGAFTTCINILSLMPFLAESSDFFRIIMQRHRPDRCPCIYSAGTRRKLKAVQVDYNVQGPPSAVTQVKHRLRSGATVKEDADSAAHARWLLFTRVLGVTSFRFSPAHERAPPYAC